MKDGYIPQKDRKKILLLTDDIRVHSGVAQVGREIVLNTAHRYNWVQLAGSIKHPEKGQKQSLSEDTNKHAGIEDASVVLYPTDGYGDEKLVRWLLKEEKPDAIFLITDPRYFEWLFAIEDEIRTQIPIVYLNIWDDLPAPMYNKEFYDSCDALFGISKQTKLINELVLGDEKAKNKLIKYVPHGLNHKMFYPIEDNKEYDEFVEQYSLRKNKDFVLFFNSRNIRRKSIPDTILAWKYFLDTLTKEERKRCQLTLHTAPVDNNGTDLPAVINFLFPDKDSQITISSDKLSTAQMNYLYNAADGVILLSAAEGWGLALTEAMLSGTPIIANVTGGMQDQMRFTDDKGDWYTNSAEIPSNHKKTYTECGEWAFPVFPKALSLVGSPKTPYIYDDRCTSEDAAEQIKALYNLSAEERKRRGVKAREWCLSEEAGFTAERMAQRVADGMDELWDTWKPRPQFTFTRDDEKNNKVLNHNLLY